MIVSRDDVFRLIERSAKTVEVAFSAQPNGVFGQDGFVSGWLLKLHCNRCDRHVSRSARPGGPEADSWALGILPELFLEFAAQGKRTGCRHISSLVALLEPHVETEAIRSILEAVYAAETEQQMKRIAHERWGASRGRRHR